MKNLDLYIIIATSLNRTDFLIERSLKSVFQQENVRPKRVIIVDDNQDPNEIENIRIRTSELKKKVLFERMKIDPETIPEDLFPVTILRNKGIHGNSGTGAWNTGAKHVKKLLDPENTSFLAILDDDDKWHSEYLFKCLETLNVHRKHYPDTDCVAIVSSINRIETNKSQEMVIHSNDISKRNFFIGNPGWQGSNTFVEINAFFQCGAYDERMSSTNDRDFAIRLMEFCEAEGNIILANPNVLVDHFAHDGVRVTTNRERKIAGLNLFYEKHINKMSLDEKRLSLERAQKLFNFSLEHL